MGMEVNLPKNVYNAMKKDFILYLKIRSDLYQSIALKYKAKLLKQQEEHGECVAYYECAEKILRHSMNKFPNEQKKKNDKASDGSSIVVMKKSINKQMQSIKTLLNAAKTENNSIYFEVVPKEDAVENPEPKFVVKAKEYEPSNVQL